jgi:hypothetical protein
MKQPLGVSCPLRVIRFFCESVAAKCLMLDLQQRSYLVAKKTKKVKKKAKKTKKK